MRNHTVLPALTLLAATLLVGCASSDTHTFESTRMRPTNVALIDTTQNSVLWRMEIPVDHELKLDLNKTGPEIESARVSDLPPNMLHWTLYDRATPWNDPEKLANQPIAQGDLELTGNPVRLQVGYRASAEVTGDSVYRIQQYRRPEGAPARSEPTAQAPATQAATQPAGQ